MAKRKQVNVKGFKHKGKIFKFKVQVFPHGRKKKIFFTNKLSRTLK